MIRNNDAMNTIKPAHVRPTPSIKVEHHFSCFVFCKSASLCSAACHFAQPNAGEIILNAVKKGHLIPQNCQLKIFDLPNAEELVLEYTRHFRLCNKAQPKIFDLPNAAEIILEYVKNGHSLCDEAELKLFGLPNASEVALEYVRQGYWFCDEAQKRIPELPNAGEIFAKLEKQK